MIYFDHAASTPLNELALEALHLSYKNDFANPAAKHKLASSLSKEIKKNKEAFLTSIGASSMEFIFTSSATESNNQVIKSFEGKEILCSLSDHPSVSNIPGVKTFLNTQKLIQDISENTSLVVLSFVNSQSGEILKIDETISLIKEKNPRVKILLDACQGYSKINFKCNKDIDYISIAAHKIGGPKGIAGLFYKKGSKVEPLLHGGGHEDGLRSSTPAFPLIKSFGIARDEAFSNLESNIEKVKEINSYVREELSQIHKNFEFPFLVENTSPYILCCLFKGVPSDVLLRHLEMKEVYISSTTACSSKIKGENPMFTGLGIDKANHKFVLRISFGSTSTIEEAKEFVEKFKEILKEIAFLIKG